MTATIKLYHISDMAYAHLTRMAVQQQYLKPQMKTQRGISTFINDLSEQILIDTRPVSIVERHTEEIKWGRAPTWRTYADRIARGLQITDDAHKHFYIAACSAGIIKADSPWLIGGPNRWDMVSITGYVLESIGLEWLTPIRLPLLQKKI